MSNQCICSEPLTDKPFYLSIKITEDIFLRHPFCSKLCRWTVARALGKELVSRYPDEGHSLCSCGHDENSHWYLRSSEGILEAIFRFSDASAGIFGFNTVSSNTAKVNSCGYNDCQCVQYIERIPVMLQGASVNRIGE